MLVKEAKNPKQKIFGKIVLKNAKWNEAVNFSI